MQVLDTLINNEYYRIAGDRVASPMSRMTESKVDVKPTSQRSRSEVLVRLTNDGIKICVPNIICCIE